MKYLALLDLTFSVHSVAELDGNLIQGTHNGMMSGTMMQGMGWGWVLLCLLFALLFFAVLIWIVRALLKYLRKPD